MFSFFWKKENKREGLLVRIFEVEKWWNEEKKTYDGERKRGIRVGHWGWWDRRIEKKRVSLVCCTRVWFGVGIWIGAFRNTNVINKHDNKRAQILKKNTDKEIPLGGISKLARKEQASLFIPPTLLDFFLKKIIYFLCFYIWIWTCIF